MTAAERPLTDYERRAEAVLLDGLTCWRDIIANLAKELEARDALVEALKELLAAQADLWKPIPVQSDVVMTGKIPSDEQIRHTKATADARVALALAGAA